MIEPDDRLTELKSSTRGRVAIFIDAANLF